VPTQAKAFNAVIKSSRLFLRKLTSNLVLGLPPASGKLAPGFTEEKILSPDFTGTNQVVDKYETSQDSIFTLNLGAGNGRIELVEMTLGRQFVTQSVSARVNGQFVVRSVGPTIAVPTTHQWKGMTANTAVGSFFDQGTGLSVAATRVAAAPPAGQFVQGVDGVFTFNIADVGKVFTFVADTTAASAIVLTGNSLERYEITGTVILSDQSIWDIFVPEAEVLLDGLELGGDDQPIPFQCFATPGNLPYTLTYRGKIAGGVLYS
jgi:hypothetical protein